MHPRVSSVKQAEVGKNGRYSRGQDPLAHLAFYSSVIYAEKRYGHVWIHRQWGVETTFETGKTPKITKTREHKRRYLLTMKPRIFWSARILINHLHHVSAVIRSSRATLTRSPNRPSIRLSSRNCVSDVLLRPFSPGISDFFFTAGQIWDTFRHRGLKFFRGNER